MVFVGAIMVKDILHSFGIFNEDEIETVDKGYVFYSNDSAISFSTSAFAASIA